MLRFSFIKWFGLWIVFLVCNANASPTQYYAQVYSEILGRSPTPAEWVANEYLFKRGSITPAGVRTAIISFYESSEFSNLDYTSSEKAYVLYRSIFLRDPGTEEMTNIANQLTRGTSISVVAGGMLNSSEFRNLITHKIGKSHPHGYLNPGPSNRSSIGSTGIGNVGGGELQEALIAAAPGTTVFLARGALVKIYNQLVIPSGVTLATYDSESEGNIFRKREAYAAMGRLVRARMFNQPLVKIHPGAKLIGVWVDGRRSQLRLNDPTLKNPALSSAERFQFSHNISLLGGANGEQVSEVSHCKITDSTGWTSLHGVGSNGSSVVVGFTRIANNLITSYSAIRDLEQSFFTDGISNASSDAIIVNNEIIDSSDVGIVLFNSGMVTGQRSQVVANSILFAGVDGWGGITLDHSVNILGFCQGVNPEVGIYNCFDVSNEAIEASFDQVLIQNNQIWSSDDNYTNVGISLGVHLWGLRMFGSGGQVVQNKLGTQQQLLQAGVGIVVSGIKQPVVLENTLNLSLDQSRISCYSTALLLDPTKTTLEPPEAMIQSGFVTGATWGMLRPKSNGYIFGNYNLLPSNEPSKAIAVETSDATLRVQDLSDRKASESWVVIHSERNFGDNQQYYLVKNRANHNVIENVEAGIRVAPFSGNESQYWRMESFDGTTPGNGLRLVNRVTGRFLGRDATSGIIASDQASSSNVSWQFRKIENRTLDLSQSEMLFMDPFGEVYQIYTDSTKIMEDRALGNLKADFGIHLFADDSSDSKPLGLTDVNKDGRLDAAFLLSDGSLFIAFQGTSGLEHGASLGNMRTKWGWDINRNIHSWEKPIGFVDIGGSSNEDILVVDLDGNLEVGYINQGGIAETEELGSASLIGLKGLTSSVNASIKSVGSGDFDGDGDRELLFVGSAGGLFRVDASGGALSTAVSIGNPLEDFGWGFTSNSDSEMKPVAIADVNGDGVDDVVMIEGSGYLYAYIMRNGLPSEGANLGSPQKSWNWNFNTHSRFTRPIGIAYGQGWWGW